MQVSKYESAKYGDAIRQARCVDQECAFFIGTAKVLHEKKRKDDEREKRNII